MLALKGKKLICLSLLCVLLLQIVIPVGLGNVEAAHKTVELQTLSEISAGDKFSIGIRPNGTVIGWGDNSYGQITAPTAEVNIKSVSAGSHHTLALKTDGTVLGWGDNSEGQTDIPVGLSGIKSIAAGDNFSLALKDNGAVVAWGDIPTVPALLSGVKSIAAGGAHAIALKADGTVEMWGDNTKGQITLPVIPTKVVAVAAGESFSLALEDDGTVVAWGDDTDGQITGSVGLTEVVEIVAGDNFAAALKVDGTVEVWGDITPPVGGLTGIISLVAGDTHMLAMKIDGSVVGLGDNSVGQNTIPADLTLPLKARQLSEGGNYTLAQKSDGTFAAWGGSWATTVEGMAGSLADVTKVSAGGAYMLALHSNGSVSGIGDNSFTQLAIPPTATKVVSISAGEYHSLALKVDGTVIAWGYNNTGQSVVPSLAGGIAVSSGGTHSIALKSNGEAVAWGYNIDGRSTVPADLNDAIAISAGNDNSLALKADGTVRAWGSNAYGQSTVPSDLEGVIAIFAGDQVSVALKSDGTVVGWGINHFGEDFSTLFSNVKSLSLRGMGMTLLHADGSLSKWGPDDSPPGSSKLSDLNLTEGSFTVSFNSSDTTYKYYYNGVSLSSVDVNPSVLVNKETQIYVDDTLVLPGGNKTVALDSPMAEKDIRVRLEPTFYPTVMYTIQVRVDAVGPTIQFNSSGGGSLLDVDVDDVLSGVKYSTLKYAWSNSLAIPLSGWSSFSEADVLDIEDKYLHVQVADNVGNITNGVWTKVTLPPVVTPSPVSSVTVKSNNADLVLLSVYAEDQQLELSPPFAANVVKYTAETEAKEAQIHLKVSDNRAVAKINGEVVGEKTSVKLNEGLNVFSIVVQAENGGIKEYTVTIYRTVQPMECPFVDITGHWAGKDICEAAGLGIVHGTTPKTFEPTLPITRAEFAVMLIQALNIPVEENKTASSFDDHDEIPAWAQSTIATGVEHGILHGYPDNAFRPQQLIDRIEMAAMVAKAMRWEEGSFDLTTFVDYNQISGWSKSYVKAAVFRGLMQGRSANNFAPRKMSTRAEAAVTVLRLWHLIHK